jgi:hypothetical protein
MASSRIEMRNKRKISGICSKKNGGQQRGVRKISASAGSETKWRGIVNGENENVAKTAARHHGRHHQLGGMAAIAGISSINGGLAAASALAAAKISAKSAHQQHNNAGWRAASALASAAAA